MFEQILFVLWSLTLNNILFKKWNSIWLLFWPAVFLLRLSVQGGCFVLFSKFCKFKGAKLGSCLLFFFVGVSLESMGIQWSGVRPVTQSGKRSLTIFPFIFPCNTDTPNFSIKLCMVSKVSKIFFAAYNVWKMQVYDTPIAEAIFKTWASIYKTGVNGD